MLHRIEPATSRIRRYITRKPAHKMLHSRMILQKTDSADRDRFSGCDGLRARMRFLGNFSRDFMRVMKSGLSDGL
ncbi:hypothetical protein M8J76_008590 [Diaphorina citri]|nr:hypothetical protein M8J76_008590 [Diaphorina citri]